MEEIERSLEKVEAFKGTSQVSALREQRQYTKAKTVKARYIALHSVPMMCLSKHEFHEMLINIKRN